MTTLFHSRRQEARAVNSRNLSWSESRVSDVDVLAARGMSGSPLGANLYRLKYGCDRSAYQTCFAQLRLKFIHRRQRLPDAFLHAALHEFLDNRCRACGGHSTLQIDVDEFAACGACNSTGIQRHPDAERARACSVKLAAWRRHERDYLDVLDSIESALTSHQGGMSRLLSDAA
jgi:hypothetical protein